jgi:hypothetical protein
MDTGIHVSDDKISHPDADPNTPDADPDTPDADAPDAIMLGQHSATAFQAAMAYICI